MANGIKYKQYILDKMSGATLPEILTELLYLEPHQKRRLLKEFTLTPDKEPREIIWKSEQVANRYIIKQMHDRIDKRRKYMFIEKSPVKKQIVVRNGNDFPSFFSLFGTSSKKDIFLAISCLDSKEKELLYKKYGENLDYTIYHVPLSDNEKNQIRYNVIRTMKRTIKKLESGDYVVVGILDQFTKEVDLKQVEKAVSKCQDDFKVTIYHYFGKDLKKKTLVKKDKRDKVLPDNVMRKLNRLIFDKKIYQEEFKSFISQFECVRKEKETDEELCSRVRESFVYLSNYEVGLLYKKFKSDLKNTINDGTLTAKENKEITSKIIPKLIYYTRKERIISYCKPLMEFFDPLTTFDEVLNEINTLCEDDKKLFKKKFKDNYSGVTPKNTLTLAERNRLDLLIKNMRTSITRKRKDKTGIKVSILKNIKNLLATEEFNTLSLMYGKEYAISIVLKKYLTGSTYEQISLLTQINPVLIKILSNVNDNTIKYDTEEIKVRNLIK